MKFMLRYALLLGILFYYSVALAQNLSPEVQRQVDSLRGELKVAKSDTAKIKIRRLIGVKLQIKSVGFWDTLWKDAKQFNVPFVEIKAHINLGNIYYGLGEKLKAEQHYLQALQVAKDDGNLEQAAKTLYYLSDLYLSNNNWAKALDACFKCLKLAEENKNLEMIGNVESRIGMIYFSIGGYEKSLKMHLKVLNGPSAANDMLLKVGSMMAVGSVYQALKKTDSTTHYYLKTKKYMSSLGENLTSWSVYNSIAAAYALNKSYDSALKYSEISNKMALKINKVNAILSSKVTLADIHLRMKDFSKAKKNALEAYELYQTIDFILQIPDLTRILREVFEAEGNYKEALKYYEIGVIAKDSLQSADNKKQALEKEFNYNLEKKESENKLLLQQTQIQNLKLKQNTYFLFGLGGIALLVLIIAYLFIRQNRLKAAHQKLHMEQKLISSQMNPHFVFNSLNAINHLIMTGENEKAEPYLGKFANLIRELLESNTKESISLKEEEGILNGFLEMESRRFSKSFNYSIKIDEALNTDATHIPHMMVQPFIENAIWHGLLAKDGERLVNVHFTYDTDKTLKCVVEDNGIGREASAKKHNTFKSKSLALSFVKQRLELLSETLK
ncbi:MAG: histidine kinase, partial [Bacteroidia bacterium]|nr:histidine kinase [Bacteroidia bacterium]